MILLHGRTRKATERGTVILTMPLLMGADGCRRGKYGGLSTRSVCVQSPGGDSKHQHESSSPSWWSVITGQLSVQTWSPLGAAHLTEVCHRRTGEPLAEANECCRCDSMALLFLPLKDTDADCEQHVYCCHNWHTKVAAHGSEVPVSSAFFANSFSSTPVKLQVTRTLMISR